MVCNGCEQRRRLIDEALRAYRAGDAAYRDHLRAVAKIGMDDLKQTMVKLGIIRAGSEEQ